MDLGIAGRNALITGGSRGLGRQCALSLAREGVNVAICGRTKSTIDTTVGDLETLGVKACGIVADVMNIDDMPRVHSEAIEGIGPIDILVNNAGGSMGATDLPETSLENYQAVFDFNVFNGYELSRLVLPHMQEQRWGRIINIASIYGREHGGNIAYMSAKASVIAYANHAGRSLAGTGITVNSIAPGSILHPAGSWERFQNEQSPEVVEDFISNNLPMGKFGWPEPLGDTCAFLASERADLITGACIVVDGGQGGSLI